MDPDGSECSLSTCSRSSPGPGQGSQKTPEYLSLKSCKAEEVEASAAGRHILGRTRGSLDPEDKLVQFLIEPERQKIHIWGFPTVGRALTPLCKEPTLPEAVIDS